MAQDAAKKTRDKKKTRSQALISGLAAFFFAGLIAVIGFQGFVHPDTPLPREWNPTRPLVINDPVTPLTVWKMRRAAAAFDSCLAVLDGYAALEPLAPLETSDQCFIRDRVDVSMIGDARLSPLETRCAIVLRTAMWERHSLQPAAIEILGSPVARIAHLGSYNCRQMRTSAGASARMSTHATADAIDIAGFDLADGRRIRLIQDWEPAGPEADFLRVVRDGACDWFDLTLSPAYNRLHADHFHLQSRGWGLCR